MSGVVTSLAIVLFRLARVFLRFHGFGLVEKRAEPRALHVVSTGVLTKDQQPAHSSKIAELEFTPKMGPQFRTSKKYILHHKHPHKRGYSPICGFQPQTNILKYQIKAVKM